MYTFTYNESQISCKKHKQIKKYIVFFGNLRVYYFVYIYIVLVKKHKYIPIYNKMKSLRIINFFVRKFIIESTFKYVGKHFFVSDWKLF